MDSVYDKIISNKPICNILYKVIETIYSVSLFSLLDSGGVGTLEMLETYFISTKSCQQPIG